MLGSADTERSVLRETMKILKTTSLLIMFFLAGCSISPDIGILDLRTGEMQHPKFSSARQIVVSVNRSTCTLTTLVRENNALIMRTFDKNLNHISEHSIPLFSSSYCNTSFYEVSDDLQKLAYATGRPADLRIIDIPSGRDFLQQDRFIDNRGEMPFLTWLDKSTLLTVLREYPGSTRSINEIAIFNIQSNQKTVLFNPTSPTSYNYALNSSRTLLAFEDAISQNSIYGFIKIIDLQTGELVQQIGSGTQLISNPRWSPDDSELAYVEGNKLNIWDSNNKSTRTIKIFPEKVTCYNIVMGEGIIGYESSQEITAINSLVILDSQTGNEIQRVSAKFNGRIIPLDQQTAICELGY